MPCERSSLSPGHAEWSYNNQERSGVGEDNEMGKSVI